MDLIANKAEKLAILGGDKIRTTVFASRPHVGRAEKAALNACVDNGFFSRFIGSPTPNVRQELRMPSEEAGQLKDFWSFLGGPNVRQFEASWAKIHKTKYAISVNSATSGLTTALLAAGLNPGDEVITTPLSFTATATSIVLANGVPVFADVNPETFCLDPKSVQERITPKTRAIMHVHLLGNAGDFDQILKIAKDNNLLLIEDAAQAPGSEYNGKPIGSWGDAAVFSFQETKNVMTGEGGMIVTNNPEIAEKARMIRNHGESIPNSGDSDPFQVNIIGYNFRMQEPIAALGWVQAEKLQKLNAIRRKNGLYLYKKLKALIPNWISPQRLTNPDHFSPYCLGFRWNPESSGLHRDAVAAALRAEGIPVATGFPRLMSENMLFVKNGLFEKAGWPFGSSRQYLNWNGQKEIPAATNLQYSEYLGFFQVGWPNQIKDMNDILSAFKKIKSNADDLKVYWSSKTKEPTAFESGRR